MKTFETDAVCLKATPFEEQHLIVQFYTAERGLLRSIAKGVKKPTSKLIGACQALSINRLTLQDKPSLFPLKHYQRIDSFFTLRDNLEAMAVGMAACDLIRLIGQEGDADSQGVFHLITTLLHQLDAHPEHWAALSLSFHLALLEHNGLLFEREACVHCHQPLQYADEDRVLTFSAATGGAYCPDCLSQHRPLSTVKITGRTWHALRQPEALDDWQQAIKAHRFLQYYWSYRLERDLKSFDFLFQLSPEPAHVT
jgi:DNA repair protein RecO (recombination protein O)